MIKYNVPKDEIKKLTRQELDSIPPDISRWIKRTSNKFNVGFKILRVMWPFKRRGLIIDGIIDITNYYNKIKYLFPQNKITKKEESKTRYKIHIKGTTNDFWVNKEIIELL